MFKNKEEISKELSRSVVRKLLYDFTNIIKMPPPPPPPNKYGLVYNNSAGARKPIRSYCGFVLT